MADYTSIAVGAILLISVSISLMSLSAKLAYPFNSGKWLRDKGIRCKGWKEKVVEWFLGASLLIGWGFIFYFTWCGVIGFFGYDKENIAGVAVGLAIPSFLWLFMQLSNYYALYAENQKLNPSPENKAS